MAVASEEALFLSACGVADSLLLMEERLTQEALEQTVAAVLSMPQFGSIDGIRLLKELEAKTTRMSVAIPSSMTTTTALG